MSCIANNCSNKAIYNYKNAKGQKYCKEHKLDNMANKTKKICLESDCIKNICKYSKLYCTEHYLKDVNHTFVEEPKKEKVKTNSNPNCIIENCNVSANYNKKGLKAIYCANHAKEIGIDNEEHQLRNVRTKLCEYKFENGLDCIKIALFGQNNKKQFCKDHNPDSEQFKKLNKDKRCKFENCNKVPNYGLENGVKEYCAEHKLENMIQLFQKCIIDDCNKRARYNRPNEKGAKYCAEHKNSEMKDNTKKICIEEECEREAHYNFKNNNNGIYCSIHKKDNMCSNKHKICKYQNCIIEAHFGTKEDSKQYCCTHKKDNMFDYRSKKCLSCNLYNVRREPFLCSYCNPNNKSFKTQEMNIVNYLKDNNINFIHNKSVGFACGNYRPDILIDCNTHFIVIEIDEDQHKQYEQSCEFIRMNNIYLSLGLPTIFIRFNPDNFYINNKRSRIGLDNRLKTLLSLINKFKLKLDINIIELYYLYFDCDCNYDCNYIHQKNFEFTN